MTGWSLAGAIGFCLLWVGVVTVIGNRRGWRQRAQWLLILVGGVAVGWIAAAAGWM